MLLQTVPHPALTSQARMLALLSFNLKGHVIREQRKF